MAEKVGIAPSEFIEGAMIPVDQNLRLKEARFCHWDYNGKAPKTAAARVTWVADDGSEHIQYYSAGDPSKL
ncbi:hypothetical protein LCGC14_3124690, partial [marine sediment metagenome]